MMLCLRSVFCVLLVVVVSSSTLAYSLQNSNDDIIRRYPEQYPEYYGVIEKRSWHGPLSTRLSDRNSRIQYFSEMEWLRGRLIAGKGPGPAAHPVPRTKHWQDIIEEHKRAEMEEKGALTISSVHERLTQDTDVATLLNLSKSSLSYSLDGHSQRPLQPREQRSHHLKQGEVIRYSSGGKSEWFHMRPAAFYLVRDDEEGKAQLRLRLPNTDEYYLSQNKTDPKGVLLVTVPFDSELYIVEGSKERKTNMTKDDEVYLLRSNKKDGPVSVTIRVTHERDGNLLFSTQTVNVPHDKSVLLDFRISPEGDRFIVFRDQVFVQ